MVSHALSAAGRASHTVRTPLKRFSHAQIAEKVAERRGLSDYYRLLMSAAVKTDEAGVVFDSSSAGWKELVRRCEEADQQQERDSRRSAQAQQDSDGAEGRRGEDRGRRRSVSPLPSGSPLSTASSSSSQPSSSAAPLLLPASASAFFSKVSSIISSRPATAADAQQLQLQHGTEPVPEDSLAINGGREQPRRPASSRSAGGHHARHSSDVPAPSPPVASPALSRPTSSHTLRPDRQLQDRKARRVTAHPPSQAAQLQPQQTQSALSPAAAPTPTAEADAEPSDSAASPAAAAGAGVRQVRLVRSAAHRTSGDRIRRSAGRELKDGSYVAADLHYEQSLLAELSGAVSDDAVIADWRERRQREMERETERKRREDAEERQRVAAGGRRRRKLVIPPTPVIQHAGAAVAELDYMQLLLAQLQLSADDDVDWTLVSRLSAVTGIPARHRLRLWTRLLRLRPGQQVQDEQDDDDDRPDEQSSLSSSNSEEKAEDEAESSASPDAATAASSSSAAEAGSESERVSPSTFFSPLAVDAVLPAPLSSASSASASSVSSPSLSSPKLDLINQRVIRVDIERTLPHLQSMRRADVRHDMEVLLTRYCKQQRISYKQGMNYLLAPFFFLQPLPLSRAGRHGLSALYSAFISALLPNTFSDEEFGSLQCLFLLFRHLLLYHDPQLCLHLDGAEMGPELYCSSWFITLYANRCRLEVALYLWDLLLLEADAGDPLLHYFVSLALLIANRAAILREAEVSLPELLSKLSINSRKDALTLLQRAKRLYRHNTSRGCMARLHDITAAKVSIDSPAYSELAAWSCLQLSAEELIANLLPPAAPQPHSAGALKFFVLDCRPAERYESGHLPQSLHLDPSLLEERRADELERRLEGVTAMRGCHFALLADSSRFEPEADGAAAPPPSAAVSFLSLLLRRGIKYLSLISGGYSACHACILRLERSSELIDHRPDDCLECNGKTAVRKEKRTLLGSMRKIGSAMIARLDSSQQTAEQTQQAYYHFTPQHKAEHLPDAVALLPTTAQLRLLMTVSEQSSSSDLCSHCAQR